MHRQVLETREKVLGPEHPDTLTSISNLRLVLLSQGKYKEAEVMHWRDLEGSEKVLKRKHLLTLININNLRFALLRQSKYKEAEAIY